MGDWKINTKAVHSGADLYNNWGASTIPIYQTASFAYDTAEELAQIFNGKEYGYIYSRISNPTVTAFEQRICALENGVGAVATSSGMAAITLVILCLTRQEDEIIASKSLFGGTMHLFNQVLKKYGVKTIFVTTCDPDAYKAAISEKTRLIFVETIGNPKLDVPDIGKISLIARKHNIPLVVDSTLTTPCLFQAKKQGVSLVVHSATKYITGNGTAVGGVVVDTGNFDWSKFNEEDFLAESKKINKQFVFLSIARKIMLQYTGASISPLNAFLHYIGIESLPLRMTSHCDNALLLAHYFKKHPKIKQIQYPGLQTNHYYHISKHLFNNRFGGLMTIRLETKEKCFHLVNNLELVKNLANLGDTKTLIIHPASTIYNNCSKEEREGAGVTDDLLRISVGIEDMNDIIEDFDRALKKL